ncbi:MAG: PIN domain-containing protein [Thiohalomonadaceae bacterium]
MVALAAINIQQLTAEIQQIAIKIRRTTSLKLPDSIISATAIYGGYVLITDDEKLRNHHVGKSLKLEDLL